MSGASQRGIPAGDEQELDDGSVRCVYLRAGKNGRPRQAIVLKDASGTIRAYVNECRHLPVPLDAGSLEFLDKTGENLMCRTHGALFRRSDGYCIEGPCRGLALVPLRVRRSGTALYVLEDLEPSIE